MAEEVVPFHKRVKGSLAEEEDWWRLVIADDGEHLVEHEWSYVNAYKASASSANSGKDRVPLKAFLDGPTDSGTKDKLRELLHKRGIPF